MVLVITYNPIPAIAADYLKVAILKEPKKEENEFLESRVKIYEIRLSVYFLDDF